MSYFDKAFDLTMRIGFGALGIFLGILLLRITLEVAGFLLGSTLGTIVFAGLLYAWYKRYRRNHF
jgi:Na+-driven multidrug efflux pump